MQRAVFDQGGFVLHRITLPGSPCRFSAWADRAGELLDAARYDAREREYSVPRASRQWRELLRIARREV